MKKILLFLAFVPFALAQTYALKTPDNTGLFFDPKTGQPMFLKAEEVKTPSEYWLVDSTLAAGMQATGWVLDKGKCVLAVKPIPAPTAEQLAAQAAVTKAIADEAARRSKVDALPIVNKARVQTNASGLYTWTFSTPYPPGVVPNCYITPESVEAGIAVGQVVLGSVTNTQATFKVWKMPITNVLTVLTLGTPSTAATWASVHAESP